MNSGEFGKSGRIDNARVVVDLKALKSVNDIIPAFEREPTESPRQAVQQVIPEAYLRQPDSGADANDWSNAEAWRV
jgi:hypothetical protein